MPRPVLAASIYSSSRIAAIARSEVGHDLAHVGASRTGLPGRLAQYVPSGGLWCSDFVSWVYASAGAPFTGGYHGGWLLPNNVAIRRWFIRRGAWVDRDHPGWRTFIPQSGDYVRIRTPTWGHSAIVWYVQGSTLHTIEGNAGGRVIMTRYPNYATHAHIDGFGRVGH